jgi:hypothetical protein
MGRCRNIDPCDAKTPRSGAGVSYAKRLCDLYCLKKTVLMKAGGACVLAFLVYAGFGLIWESEYKEYPRGDSVYFANMAYSAFSPAREEIKLPPMHSRRVLMPVLVGGILRLSGVVTAERFELRRIIPIRNEKEKEVYGKFQDLWGILNLLFFVTVCAVIALLLPRRLTPALYWLAFMNFMLTPSMGLLYIRWPIMNDVLFLALFGAGVFFLSRGRETFGLILIGLSGVAREQALLLLPFVYMFVRFSVIKAVVFALGPYIALTVFPLFPGVVRWIDFSSQTITKTTGIAECYWNILRYHMRAMYLSGGFITPVMLMFNCGTSIVLAFMFRREKDLRMWVLLALCVLFQADRHMAAINFLFLLGLQNLPAPGRDERRERFAVYFLFLTACGRIAHILLSKDALWLQVEHWFRVV